MYITLINNKTPLQLSSQYINSMDNSSKYYVVDQIQKEYRKRRIHKNHSNLFSVCQQIFLNGLNYQRGLIENPKKPFKYLQKNSIYEIMFINKITHIEGNSKSIKSNHLETFLSYSYHWQELFKAGMTAYFNIDNINPTLTFKDYNKEGVTIIKEI